MVATGDSLFPGGVGSTFGDAQALATLISEVETNVFNRLGDDTWFYPGTASPASSRTNGRTSPSGASAVGEPSV